MPRRLTAATYPTESVLAMFVLGKSRPAFADVMAGHSTRGIAAVTLASQYGIHSRFSAHLGLTQQSHDLLYLCAD
jgi:hypothetical protein